MKHQLELHQLAAYLPYELKAYVFDEVLFLKKYIQECPNGEWAVPLTFNNFQEHIFKNGYKPILYPLDYLTKEITHNGETFVPVNKLFEHYEDVVITKYESNQLTLTATYKIVEDGDVFTEFIVFQNTIVDVRYWIVETLLEWKLDVFNLIENKLAVAVTEDFNPYK